MRTFNTIYAIFDEHCDGDALYNLINDYVHTQATISVSHAGRLCARPQFTLARIKATRQWQLAMPTLLPFAAHQVNQIARIVLGPLANESIDICQLKAQPIDDHLIYTNDCDVFDELDDNWNVQAAPSVIPVQAVDDLAVATGQWKWSQIVHQATTQLMDPKTRKRAHSDPQLRAELLNKVAAQYADDMRYTYVATLYAQLVAFDGPLDHDNVAQFVHNGELYDTPGLHDGKIDDFIKCLVFEQLQQTTMSLVHK